MTPICTAAYNIYKEDINKDNSNHDNRWTQYVKILLLTKEFLGIFWNIMGKTKTGITQIATEYIGDVSHSYIK